MREFGATQSSSPDFKPWQKTLPVLLGILGLLIMSFKLGESSQYSFLTECIEQVEQEHSRSRDDLRTMIHRARLGLHELGLDPNELSQALQLLKTLEDQIHAEPIQRNSNKLFTR